MIAIFAAMESEVQPLLATAKVVSTSEIDNFAITQVTYNGLPAVICRTGIGGPAAEAAAAVLDRYSPHAVISVGIAGGIAAGLRAGDVVLCQRLCICEHREAGLACEVIESDARLLGVAQTTLHDAGLAVIRGSTITVPVVVATPEDKLRLWGASRHDIVEMESYWVGKAAFERGIPSLTVRTVSDQADDTVVIFGDAIRPDGSLDYPRLAEWARENPQLTNLFPNMVERVRIGNASLGRFAEAFLRPGVWESILPDKLAMQ